MPGCSDPGSVVQSHSFSAAGDKGLACNSSENVTGMNQEVRSTRSDEGHEKQDESKKNGLRSELARQQQLQQGGG